MLAKLSVKNYALIESLEIDFSSGFSVFTGETGSGKSILMGALQLLIGERADFKSLFNKNQKCIVEGVFSSVNFLSELLLVNDLDVYKELIIRKTYKNSAYKYPAKNKTKIEQLLTKNFFRFTHLCNNTRNQNIANVFFNFCKDGIIS